MARFTACRAARESGNRDRLAARVKAASGREPMELDRSMSQDGGKGRPAYSAIQRLSSSSGGAERVFA
jgi:hypothetical protein